MTTYTPTPEAVEAAARAAFESFSARMDRAFKRPPGGTPAFSRGWDTLDEASREAYREDQRDALAAAGPIIEQEAGERIAREIERLRDALTGDPDRAALELLIEDAARIARGEGS